MKVHERSQAVYRESNYGQSAGEPITACLNSELHCSWRREGDSGGVPGGRSSSG